MQTGGERRTARRPTANLLGLAACGLALGGLLAVGGCRSEQPGDVTQVRPGDQRAGTREAVPTGEAPHQAVVLRFGGAERGEVLESFLSSGPSPVRVELVTRGAGRVLGAASPHGPAARFPAYGRDPGFAILRVVNDGADEMLGSVEDVLSPGESDFAFGADVALDRVSSGSRADDGDNVIQRGRFGSPSQYKIQVDQGRPSCLVRGLAGEVYVAAEVRMAPDHWYRVRCSRRDDTLRLHVARLRQDGLGEWSTSTGSGELGPVVMPSSTPLSVAGKLADDGTLVPASTDQLNGRLDRVFYRVLR